MFKNKFPWTKVSAAFAIGAMAGAAVALFLTPMNGRKFTKEFKNAVNDQVDNVEKILKKAVAV